MSESQLPAPTEREIQDGKTLAMVSWLSGIVGLPLFVIPMIQRDNAYALYHAKHAAMTYIIQVIIGVLFMAFSVLTCGGGGVLFPVVLLPLIPTIDGLIKGSGGRVEPPMIIGDFTDKLFGGLTVDEDKRRA